MWATRFLHDELWLRSRRVLQDAVESDSYGPHGPEEFHAAMGVQRALGEALLEELKSVLGRRCVRALSDETFLSGPRGGFSQRLPFILAFLADFADWLGEFVNSPPETRATARRLAALLNLGVVLVDHVTDEPERYGTLDEVLPEDSLRMLLSGAVLPTPSRGAASSSPQVAILQAVVAAFFRDAQVVLRDADPRSAVRFADAITGAYLGQRDTANEAPTLELLRQKSVNVFAVVPPLVSNGGAADRPDLARVAMHVGEVFWRVDDLVDVSRDWAAGDANLALLLGRRGDSSRDPDEELADLMRGSIVETIAGEVAEHRRAALDLLGDRPSTRARAQQWMDAYILDWMR